MEDDDYKKYVCVEPGCVCGVRNVGAKEVLSLKQEMKVSEL